MIRKVLNASLIAAAAIGMTAILPIATAAKADTTPVDFSNRIWVRILPMGLPDQGWQLTDKNGQDILDMISQLKPNVLSRFITGKPDLSWTIPMGPGRTPMRFANYLTAAMTACQPRCFLTPKLMLNQTMTDQYRHDAAQALFDMPVTPRLKALDLDTYYQSGTDAEHKADLQSYKAIGWTDLGFNFAGGSKTAFGLVTYAMAGVDGTTGAVNLTQLSKMAPEGITVRLAHIDYPTAIDEFKQLTPDQQATIIQNVSRQQHQDNFTFIYPVLYGTQGYDSTTQVTRPNGPFKGATVFEVIRQMIICDKKYPQPCTPQF